MTQMQILEMIKEDFDNEYFDNYYDFEYIAGKKGYKVMSGCSRTVLYKEAFGDYVVKLSFGNDYDRDGSSFETGENYFSIENSIYENSVAAGLSEFFVPNIYLGNMVINTTVYTYDDEGEEDGEEDYISSVDIYLQKKVDKTFSNYECGRRYSKDCYKKESRALQIAHKSHIRYNNFDGEAECFIVRKYGIKKFIELSKFIDEEGITDLHNDNFGLKNGEIIFFDYGGYWG